VSIEYSNGAAKGCAWYVHYFSKYTARQTKWVVRYDDSLHESFQNQKKNEAKSKSIAK